MEADAHTEGSLAAEISMVALDTLELIVQVRVITYRSRSCEGLKLGGP